MMNLYYGIGWDFLFLFLNGYIVQYFFCFCFVFGRHRTAPSAIDHRFPVYNFILFYLVSLLFHYNPARSGRIKLKK